MPIITDHTLKLSDSCKRRAWRVTWIADDEHSAVGQTGRALRRDALLREFAQISGATNIMPRGSSWAHRVVETRRLIDDGATEIMGAAFEVDGVQVSIDHMKRVEDTWVLTTVRGSTSRKASHVRTLGLGLWVLNVLNVPVGDVRVATVNPRSVSRRDHTFFTTRSVYKAGLALAQGLTQTIDDLRATLQAGEPEATPGRHCRKPDLCPYLPTCQPAEDPQALADLYRVKAKLIKQLEGQGVTRIADIPSSIALPPIASRQRDALQKGATVVSPQLRDQLATIRRPTAYIDFEAIQPAVPLWPGTAPFAIVPVQVSIHRLDADGSLHHASWLAPPMADPRPELARFVARHLEGAETLVAYHSTFERSILKRLEAFASERAAAILRDSSERLVDLLPIIRENVYHVDFKGKFNLKSVVGALIPDLSYDDLQIRRGDEASLVLEAHCRGNASVFDWSDTEREQALLSYCARDTLVMVRLEETLRELVVSG